MKKTWDNFEGTPGLILSMLLPTFSLHVVIPTHVVLYIWEATKKLMINKQQHLHVFGTKYAGIIVCEQFSESIHVAWGKQSFEKKKMFKGKYPSIFSPQMEPIVFTIRQIFFATHAVLKIGQYNYKQ